MGFFNWIRSCIKSAVLAGFQDAMNELDSTEGSVQPISLALEYRWENFQPDSADASDSFLAGMSANKRGKNSSKS